MPQRPVDKISQRGNSQWGLAPSQEFTCAWCGRFVASTFGVDSGMNNDGSGQWAGSLRACTNCGYPSFMDQSGRITPGVAYGDDVSDAPEQVAQLYGEARDCVSVGANHAAVMVCRKILMNVAVLQGAAEGASFVTYVTYLVDHHLIPPGAARWVDEIRQIGNDANHEIIEIGETDAKAAVDFVAMLLKLLYEFPARGNASVAARAEKDAATVADG
ncbi:MAG TPA: DUF4145 domain-containing protein [Solirubrobacteraceae bacterium]|nr:DUF4145 domain-containing protein [Solirubrobacteraceae bacterium]